jgi:hypothetical protein
VTVMENESEIESDDAPESETLILTDVAVMTCYYWCESGAKGSASESDDDEMRESETVMESVSVIEIEIVRDETSTWIACRSWRRPLSSAWLRIPVESSHGRGEEVGIRDRQGMHMGDHTYRTAWVEMSGEREDIKSRPKSNLVALTIETHTSKATKYKQDGKKKEKHLLGGTKLRTIGRAAGWPYAPG